MFLSQHIPLVRDYVYTVPPTGPDAFAPLLCDVESSYGGSNPQGTTHLHLKFDGTNGSAVSPLNLKDRSNAGAPLVVATAAGMVYSNDTAKFGTTSLKQTGGSGGTISLAAVGEWTGASLGSQNFTIEGWWRFTNVTGLQEMCSFYFDGGLSASWFLARQSTAQLQIMMVVGGVRYQTLSAINVLAINTWHHIAMVRDGTVMRGYVDGVQVIATTVGSGSIGWSDGFGASWRPWMSSNASSTHYVQEILYSIGICKYPSGTTFTVPTDYQVTTPVVPETALMLHFDGADGATSTIDSALTPIAFGAATGTAALSTARAKYGVSSLNPGTGNFAMASTRSLNLGGDDWTIECWFYMTGTITADTGFQALFSTLDDATYAGAAGAMALGIFFHSVSSTSRLTFYSETAQLLSPTDAVALNQWNHVAVVRHGGLMYMYLNGTRIISFTMLTSTVGHWARGPLRIGGGPTLTFGGGKIQSSFVGNIDELLWTRGLAKYTANSFVLGTKQACDATSVPFGSLTKSPLRCQVTVVPCLDATQASVLSSTIIANIDTDSTNPSATYVNVPSGLTPTLTWIGPTAATLALAGTPTAPGNYRFIATLLENNSTKVLGTVECDITIWPSAGTFSPGALASPTGRVGVPATLQLTAPSANYNVDISTVSNLPVPGMSLVTAWTPGVTSSGTVSLVGTPTAAGTYALTLTYRRKSTCEIRDLATSTHTVTIGALTAPPAPAPAPAPAPTPAPSPAPTPPGISQGPVPDNLWSSVAILQQWNNSRTIMSEVGDSAVRFDTFYMDARGRHEMTEPVPFSATEGAGDAGAAGGSSLCYVGDSLWQTDGNLTAECFYRMSAADVNYLFGSSTETRLLVMMSLNSNSGTGNFMWKLGYSSSIEDGRRVVRPTFIQGRVGGPAGNSPIQCFGPEISSPPFSFFHLAGQVVLSGGTTEIAAWHNGVGGGATKIVTSGQSYRLVTGNNFKAHEGSKPNCAPTGGLAYSGTRSASGYIDQMRVTKAQRYTATAGVTDAIDRAKITPPFLAS